MLYVNNLNISLNFTHIPRTGGRYIHKLLEANNFRAVEPARCYYQGRELLHLDRKRSLNFYSKEALLNNFCIIRNPIDKFLSNSWWLNFFKIPITNINSDYDLFKFTLDQIEVWGSPSDWHNPDSTIHTNGLRNAWCGWFQPQYEYIINHSTLLWKFENNLKDGFVNCINENFGLDIKNLDNIRYEKINYDSYEKIKLDNKLLKNITTYYADDMDLWERLI